MILAANQFAGRSFGGAVRGENIRAEDFSGSGNHGEYRGGLPTPVAGAIAWGTNVIGQEFNGLLNYISVGDPANLSFTDNIFTIEFWVRIDAGYFGAIGILGKRGGPWEYAVYRYPDASGLGLAAWTTGGASVYGNSIANISDGLWHHVLWTADGSFSSVFMDGVLHNRNAKTVDSMSNTSSPFEIGRSGDAGTFSYLKGRLDEVVVYHAALTAVDAGQRWAAQEGPNTNYLWRSEEFDSGNWSKTDATISPNVTTAPNQTGDADQLTESATTNYHRIFQGITLIANQSLTFSIYVKAGGRSRVGLQITDGGANNVYWIYNLSTMVITPGSIPGGSVSASITDVGNGWRRLVLSWTLCPLNPQFFLYMENATTNFYAGDGASQVYLWGAMVEPGATVHRYLPNGGSAAFTVTTYTDLLFVAATPVGYWKLNEAISGYPNGTEYALDASPNGKHGTYWGGLPTPVAGLVPWDANRAQSFDGVDDYVEVPSSVADLGNSDMTLEFFYRGALDVAVSDLFHKGTGGPFNTNGTGFGVRFQNALIEFARGDGAGVPNRLQETLTPNLLMHIVITYKQSNGLAQLWVNGVAVNSVIMNQTGAFADSFPFWIMRGADTFGRGVVDEVALYTSLLSTTKILQHWGAQEGPNRNCLPRSGEMSELPWITTNCSMLPNDDLGPDNTFSADKLQEETGAADFHYINTSTVGGIPDGEPVTFSIHARADDRDQVAIVISDGTTFCIHFFDLTLGQTFTVTQPAYGVATVGAQAMADGWWRVWITWDAPADGTTPGVYVYVCYNGSSNYPGVAPMGIYVWGAQFEIGTTPKRYLPTEATDFEVLAYNALVLSHSPAGYWRLGETTVAALDQGDRGWNLCPFRVEINGILAKEFAKIDSVSGSDTAGQPKTCQFTLKSPTVIPRSGTAVRVLYFDEVLFSGLIERVQGMPTQDLVVKWYMIDCVDWSHVLNRTRIRRNFVNQSVVGIIDLLLDDELKGNGLSIGAVDFGPIMPMVDARNAKAFDVLRDLAAATGQALSVDDKVINMRGVSNPASPKGINYSTVEESVVVDDLETYRNVMTVIVTGTSPPGVAQVVNVVVVSQQDDQQIAARQAIEGGSGRYEEILEIIHPFSNVTAELAIMGLSVARLQLQVSGRTRRTLRVRVRGWGFKAGQIAPVDLPAIGATGSWLIQRASWTEQVAQQLVYDLELVQSTTQQRAYEAWLEIVKQGKVTIAAPGTVTTNTVSFTTPGSTTWPVPAGVTKVTLKTIGGSGGGGGGALLINYPPSLGGPNIGLNGGEGGRSGFGQSTIDVVEGDVLSIVVGAKGTGGASASVLYASDIGVLTTGAGDAIGADGTDGGLSSVTRGGKVAAQGNGGQKGTGAKEINTHNQVLFPHYSFEVGSDGPPGSGIGDGVTVGGGKNGGARGTGSPFVNGANGQDGSVEILY